MQSYTQKLQASKAFFILQKIYRVQAYCIKLHLIIKLQWKQPGIQFLLSYSNKDIAGVCCFYGRGNPLQETIVLCYKHSVPNPFNFVKTYSCQ